MHPNFSSNHYLCLLSTFVKTKNIGASKKWWKLIKKLKTERGGKQGHKYPHVTLIWGQSKESWGLLETVSHGGRKDMILTNSLLFTAHPYPKSSISPPHPLSPYKLNWNVHLFNLISYDLLRTLYRITIWLVIIDSHSFQNNTRMTYVLGWEYKRTILLLIIAVSPAA